MILILYLTTLLKLSLSCNYIVSFSYSNKDATKWKKCILWMHILFCQKIKYFCLNFACTSQLTFHWFGQVDNIDVGREVSLLQFLKIGISFPSTIQILVGVDVEITSRPPYIHRCDKVPLLWNFKFYFEYIHMCTKLVYLGVTRS